jgi:hypothetical protein
LKKAVENKTNLLLSLHAFEYAVRQQQQQNTLLIGGDAKHNTNSIKMMRMDKIALIKNTIDV